MSRAIAFPVMDRGIDREHGDETIQGEMVTNNSTHAYHSWVWT